MSAVKRDHQGARRYENPKPKPAPKLAVRNAYTPMFERLRDEMDAHYDRRERIVKSSRDVTALSKKIVRKIEPQLPQAIQSEVDARLADISDFLATLAPDVQGINRHRYAYQLMCLEELVEALSFAHYLRTQSLVKPQELGRMTENLARQGAASAAAAAGKDAVMRDAGDAGDAAPPEEPILPVSLTDSDYLFGLFDLTGEMMRFATTASALSGQMAGYGTRSIVQDMQNLASFFEMLPLQTGFREKATWEKKMEVMRASVQKVEKLGYDRVVRGSERPDGWVPDLNPVEHDSEGV